MLVEINSAKLVLFPFLISKESNWLSPTFKDVKPEVVIHAAAMKHIDLMETNPIAGCNVNVIGSLNVAEASIINDVPITVGVSTDKACLPESVYGASKYIMERVFMLRIFEVISPGCYLKKGVY